MAATGRMGLKAGRSNILNIPYLDSLITIFELWLSPEGWD